jgi:parvulin-like peptidyl-prolyl isomerase
MPDNRAATIAILAVAILTLATTACERKPSGSVLARVQGKEITLARFMDYYRPPPSMEGTVDDYFLAMSENLDELIGYTLVQEGGRADGLHKTQDFNARLASHEKNLLNRIYKQREIVEKILVDEAEVDSFLARSRFERHVQHIVTLSAPAAREVTLRLERGDEWSDVAIAYSMDAEKAVNRGDLGWIRWGESQFTYYPDLQRALFRAPIGNWEGPVQSGNEFHFINIVEERQRDFGDVAEERARARGRVAGLIQRDLEQQLSNDMWNEGGFHLDEDHFRWLVEEITESFDRNPGSNPVPVLSAEDNRRLVIRSDTQPYTARALLDRLELRNPQARDNALTLLDWRQLFIEWALTDIAAQRARRAGYDKDPAYLSERTTFIDGRLYALKLNELEDERGVPTDEILKSYYQDHPEEFNLPEMRRLNEVLLATRDEADEILRRLESGENIEILARSHSIRPDIAQRGGRFSPIRRGEFGALGEAVFEADAGELGPIVETPLGFSVFKVTQVIPPRVIELEDIRQDLRARMARDWERENVAQFKARARERAQIWRNEELLRWYAEQHAASRARQAEQAAGAATSVPPERP